MIYEISFVISLCLVLLIDIRTFDVTASYLKNQTRLVQCITIADMAIEYWLDTRTGGKKWLHEQVVPRMATEPCIMYAPMYAWYYIDTCAFVQPAWTEHTIT